jgi:hypothetical protein
VEHRQKQITIGPESGTSTQKYMEGDDGNNLATLPHLDLVNMKARTLPDRKTLATQYTFRGEELRRLPTYVSDYVQGWAGVR